MMINSYTQSVSRYPGFKGTDDPIDPGLIAKLKAEIKNWSTKENHQKKLRILYYRPMNMPYHLWHQKNQTYIGF
jgi:hypothetical protein